MTRLTPVTRTLRAAVTRSFGSRPSSALVTAVSAAERRLLPRSAGRLPIVTFHRVSSAEESTHLLPSLRSADPTMFEHHIDRLARHHRFLGVDELLAVRRGEAPPAPDTVLLTFDDAYRDFATNAWPVLRARRIPVLLFVPTGFVGTQRAFWWDAVHQAISRTAECSLQWRGRRLDLSDERTRAKVARQVRDETKQLPHDEAMAAVDDLVRRSGVDVEPATILDWDELRGLRNEGVTLAPHTRTHAFLDRVDPRRARQEIEGSMADLEAQVGACPPVFAYPSGQVDAACRRVVAEAGIEVAVTTRRGVNRLGDADWLGLDRINVGASTAPAALEAQLLRTTAPLLSGLGR